MRLASGLGGFALAVLTTLSAQAADLGAPPASPYIPANFYWTGFYLGGEAGGGWAKSAWVDVLGPGPASATVTGNGYLGGGYVGLNYQIGVVVVGIEGAFDGTWLNGNTTDIAGNNLKSQVIWTATATGRLGLALDRLLIYGRGGAAFANDRATETAPAGQGIGTANRNGWTFGGGVEYAFTEHFTARVEYDYLTFQSRSYSLAGTLVAPPTTPTIGLNIGEVKAGVGYKF